MYSPAYLAAATARTDPAELSERANTICKQRLGEDRRPTLHSAIDEKLTTFVARRKKAIADTS